MLDLLGRGAAASSEFKPPPQWVILSVIAPVAVVRRVLLHKKTTIQTLIGAVTAYLLMAVAFTLIFLSLDGTQGSFFFGTEQPTTSFMYFSLVTITTTGYGDLAAVAPHRPDARDLRGRDRAGLPRHVRGDDRRPARRAAGSRRQD